MGVVTWKDWVVVNEVVKYYEVKMGSVRDCGAVTDKYGICTAPESIVCPIETL